MLKLLGLYQCVLGLEHTALGGSDTELCYRTSEVGSLPPVEHW